MPTVSLILSTPESHTYLIVYSSTDTVTVLVRENVKETIN